MHSHAVAQKLSAWIFAVLGGEGAGFWPARARIALRGSAGVRPRTLMLNPGGLAGSPGVTALSA